MIVLTGPYLTFTRIINLTEIYNKVGQYRSKHGKGFITATHNNFQYELPARKVFLP